ncbi:glycosyltransferase [bacterium]|nr:glycosyltransferase [bacterium]RQV99534.1 MAG: glycosyltransferase [bacterium]
MSILFYPLLFLLTLLYCAVLIWLIRGLPQLTGGQCRSQPSVSVIIAARNEEKNIGHCIRAILEQRYPIDQYEIIIVDDRSEDRTAEIVKEIMEKHPHVKLISIKKSDRSVSPKKYALEQGISQATGDIILTTDADCTVQPGWIEALVRHFSQDVGLVAGYSPLVCQSHPSLFHQLIALDALALAAVAAGSFGGNDPLTCNGRNLAYRRSAYDQTGGFHTICHLVSGDDDLLLHQMKKKTDWKMRYAIEKDSVVFSIPPQGFKAFFHQRIRHASKGRYYPKMLKMGLVMVYLFNLSLLVLLFLQLWIMLFAILGIKSLFEFLLLVHAARIFHQKRSLLYFPLAAILHIPYVVLFGAWAQFGKFNWKETSHTSTMHSGE